MSASLCLGSLEIFFVLKTHGRRRLVPEKVSVGARYNAVAEEGVPLREMAEAIGRGLKRPVVSISPKEAGEQFGWLAAFVGLDIPASSADTGTAGMAPDRPGNISDLKNMCYFPA